MGSWVTRSRVPASALLLKWRSISIYGVLLFLTLIYLSRRGSTSTAGSYADFEFSEKYPSKETLKSLSLTEEQCDATFPGLTKQIELAVARGSFELKKGPDTAHGSVDGRIKDGKVGRQASNLFRWLTIIAVHHLCRTRQCLEGEQSSTDLMG